MFYVVFVVNAAHVVLFVHVVRGVHAGHFAHVVHGGLPPPGFPLRLLFLLLPPSSPPLHLNEARHLSSLCDHFSFSSSFSSSTASAAALEI